MTDFAAVVIAVAFVVLVGYIVPTVIQLRKTVFQFERLLSQINAELPGLLKEIKMTSENVKAMSAQGRDGVKRASVLMDAIGAVGQTVNQIHEAVLGKCTTLMASLGRVLAGMKAGGLTLKDHVQKEGGQINGKK